MICGPSLNGKITLNHMNTNNTMIEETSNGTIKVSDRVTSMIRKSSGMDHNENDLESNRFGIKVSGGTAEDPPITVTDIQGIGPALEKLKLEDIIVGVNGVSMAGFTWDEACELLKQSEDHVELTIQRTVNLSMKKQKSVKQRFGGGGSEKCQSCKKTVYFAEKMIGPESKIYHKRCLTCQKCPTNLSSGSWMEHENLPYCKGCYARCFGPGGKR